MNRELFAEITTGDLIYLSSAMLAGLLLALITRLIGGRLKARQRRRDPASIGAELVDDLDGALSLWIALAGVYLGLLGLPPLGDHLFALRQAFTVVSVAVVVYGGIRVQGDAITWATERIGQRTGQAKVLNSLGPLARQIAGTVTLAMGILVVLDLLGISIAPLVAGLGIGGLAVALALQGTLTNFFAGLNVMTDGSIRVGDYLELEGGMIGVVDMIGWRTTRIRLLSNNMVMVPNARLADNIATNYNHPVEEMSVYVQVGVSYFSDLDHVERVTVDVAAKVLEETPGSVKAYQPTIWYTGFGDSNISFWVVLRAQGYMESWLIQHNFIKALFRRYDEEGIEISFPARNVFMRDGTGKSQSAQALQEGDGS